MATINEEPRKIRWVRTVLAADPTIAAAVGTRIYEGAVPKGKALPAIVYYLIPMDDVQGSGQTPMRTWSKSRLIAKVINETNDPSTLQTVADRIEHVLHAAMGGTADIEIDYCIRRRPFYMKDTSVKDKIFIHLGGEFELAARYVA